MNCLTLLLFAGVWSYVIWRIGGELLGVPGMIFLSLVAVGLLVNSARCKCCGTDKKKG